MMAPILYIVGTPIGNLQDFSPRAVTILKNCDLILAEDTRHSIYLMKSFSISTPLKSYHQHNEAQRAQEVLELLKLGKKIAIISDAGMPMISDPGYILVKLALENNIEVSSVPGPTALASAISISGIDCRKFCFEGFLSSKQQARQNQLEDLANERRAIVLYEAPHRLLDSLEDIKNILGSQRQLAVIKEITKQYEQVFYGTAQDVLDKLSTLETIKGEYVLVIAGNDAEVNHLDEEIIKTLKLFRKEGLSLKQAVKLTTELSGLKKNYVYQLALYVFDS